MLGMVDAKDGRHRTGEMNIVATASLRNSGVNLIVKTIKSLLSPPESRGGDDYYCGVCRTTPYCGICLQLALRDLLILKLISLVTDERIFLFRASTVYETRMWI